VCSFPESGQKIENGPGRYVVVEHFVILFEVIGDYVIVQRVCDGRRDLDFLNTGENDVNDGID